MATKLGFGKIQPEELKAQEKAKANKEKRAVAAEKYDEMKKKGLPEYNIYTRLQGQKNWLPGGSLTVERSDKINQALFQQEEELFKGVIRLYPKMRAQKENLEYGYRLKEFADEEVTLAIRPKDKPSNLFEAAFQEIKHQFSKVSEKLTQKPK